MWPMSALPPKADIAGRPLDVRFSNRPVGVKRFQAIHYCGSQHHSRARASLRNRHIGRSIMGSEDEVEQSLWRPCRRQVQADMRTHLIHRPARDIIPPLGGARVFSCDPGGLYAATASLVHLNSVPSIQMRCIITANRRASATIAFFIPRCLAIFIAQALSQDHFAERSNMTWAAS
jgi:hypothetical protein